MERQKDSYSARIIVKLLLLAAENKIKKAKEKRYAHYSLQFRVPGRQL